MKIFNRDYQPDYEISSGQRVIRSDGAKYNFLFPKAEVKDTIVMDNGEVKDTLRVIESVVWESIKDTKKVAELLKQNSLEETLRAIWEFLYYNIQYKLDKPGLEELRKPSRAWHDRITGIDCDCFSIFCSSILCNLGIPHHFRVTRYSQDHWQHIYVIVPKAESTAHYTIDAVLGQFNYEKPYTQKMDFTMSLNGIKIAVLSGVEDISPAANDTGRIVMNSMQLAAANNVALHAAIFGVDLQGLGILAGEEYLLGAVKDPDIEKGLYRYLVATRQAIAENPVTAFVAGYNQQEIIKMLDYAILYWFTDKRDQALGQLIANEALLDQMNGFGNLEGLLGDDDLYGDDDILTGDDDDGVTFDDSDPGTDTGTEMTVTDAGESTGGEEAMEGLGNIATGAIKFAQNNPLLGLAIGGAVAFGIYKMLDKDKEPEPPTPPKPPPELSGPPGQSRHPPGELPVFKLQ